MRIVSMLADAAQVDQQSKVHAIGINLTRIPAGAPMSIVVLAEVPPEEAPAQLSLTLELLDSADAPVELPSPPDGQLRPVKLNIGGSATAREPENTWETVRVPWVINITSGLPEPGNYKFSIRVGRQGGHTLGDELQFCIAANPGA